MQPPLAGEAGDALRHIGAPAVAPLLEIAARPGDPAQTAAYEALDDMFSSVSIPALEAVMAGTRDDEVRRIASDLLERQKGIRDDVNKSIGRDEIRATFDRTGCTVPALLLVVAAGIVATASSLLGVGRPVE